MEDHRNAVRDAELKLQKHEGILKELQDRSQSVADAAEAASDSVLLPVFLLRMLLPRILMISLVFKFKKSKSDEEMEEG